MQHPHACLGGDELNVVALTWRDADRVLRQLRGLGDGMPIRRDNLERHTVQVHGVDELADPDEAQADAVAFLHGDGFRCREGLAVDREIVRLHPAHRHGGVGQAVHHARFGDHQHLVHRGRIGFRFLRVNDERRVQSRAHLHIALVMRVIHKRPRGLGGEFVRERLARLDRILRDARHAVHRVRDFDSVPMDRGWIGQLVLHDDPHLVALGDADHRSRHGSIVGVRGDGHAIQNRPQHGFGRQLENLDAILHAEFERLSAFGLGRGLDVRRADRFHHVRGFGIIRHHTAWGGGRHRAVVHWHGIRRRGGRRAGRENQRERDH